MNTPQQKPVPSRVRQWLGSALFTACLVASITPADAHNQSTAFLTIHAETRRLDVEWHIALRDLEDAIGLDTDDDGLITWNELCSRRDAVCAYALSRLHVKEHSIPLVLHFNDMLVDHHADGAYAVLRFQADRPPVAGTFSLDYGALFDIDSKHRALLRLDHGDKTQVAVFTPEHPDQEFELGDNHSQVVPFTSFVREGIWHIWTGYDHILFLLALLLPGVLRFERNRWEPVTAARPALFHVVRIVTAFTVAHTITLSLASLGVLHPPARWIEAAIAASVVLAAVNNLRPVVRESSWVVAFAFGLVHGFGFANALRALELQTGQLALSLFGFNLGVEVGQLAIVAVFMPLALSLRRLLFYPKVVLEFGSACIALIASGWLAERLLDVKWLPF
ncbi:MAG TPA: HupE/UreJ family protein [Verrucomicrobiae bacterium]|nr:HupE/UreJ family protein [Verrucomicrobiae bacterium]